MPPPPVFKTFNVFLFHRDYRLHDNTALLQLKRHYPTIPIVPVFIFTPDQIDPKKNPYFSSPSVQFLCASLDDLQAQLKSLNATLYVFHGNTLSVLQALVKAARASGATLDAVAWNEDYSVYATQRDSELRSWCESQQIRVHTEEDYGLLPLKEGLLPDGRPYRVLSQFYKKIMKKPDQIRRPQTTAFRPSDFTRFPMAFPKGSGLSIVSSETYHTYYTPLKDLAIHGGRTAAQSVLQRIRKGEFKDYQKHRDVPALNATTRLSPHLKFGTISVRECFWAIADTYGMSHGLLRELIFRDFYLKIYALQPELQRGTALNHALDKAIPWSYDTRRFEAWTQGRTGFPLVDAGMRELNTTGFQHNRVRMLTSSVLTKYLLIDWRWGLKYFYTHLVDADIFSNTAGWGFSSSTGPDAVPYFRAPFNPFIQSKKFDPDGTYIRQWVPELAQVAPADLHRWNEADVRAKYPQLNYPAPIVDAKEASHRAMEVFKKAGQAAARKTK